MNNIIEAISLSKKFTEVPVILVSDFGNKCYIVLIYSDDMQYSIREDEIAQENDVIRLKVMNIMKSILDDGGRIISHFFSNPIVIKDSLHIVPLIMEHIQRRHDTLYPYYGNLSVCFKRVDDISSFYSNSLVPFLNITRNQLEKSESFCLFRSCNNGEAAVYACWEVNKQKYKHADLMRHIVNTIPEINLHAMTIDYFPISSNPISQMQKWSSSRFLPIIGESGNDDTVIREVFSQYVSISRLLYESSSDYLHENLLVLNRIIPHSISTITNRVITNSMEGDILSKMMREYHVMLHKNITAIYGLLEELCSSWKHISLDKIPSDLCKEIYNQKETENNDTLFKAFQTIVSASLISPFHYGFFPYCINEILPIILHI